MMGPSILDVRKVGNTHGLFQIQSCLGKIFNLKQVCVCLENSLRKAAERFIVYEAHFRTVVQQVGSYLRRQ